MNGSDWTEVIGAAGLFTVATAVVCTVIVQVARTMRAKAALAREGEYRDLVRVSTQVQQDIDRRLTELGAEVAAARDRLTSIEKILKEVE